MVEFTKSKSSNTIEKYEISDLDTSGDPSYFGYVNSNGNWYIKKLNESNGTIRFIADSSEYSTNWINRANLIYNMYSEVF